MEELSRRIISLIRGIPRGRVATYGQIAALAGDPRGARRVARILHSSSGKRRLPWHRVINSRGGISLPAAAGYELQLSLLKAEGVVLRGGRVDLRKFGWRPVLP